MTFINENYLKLQAGYLFPEISHGVNATSSPPTPTSPNA